MRKKVMFFIGSTLFFFGIVRAQEKQSGPIIPDYGKVFSVQEADFKTDTDRMFKVVFDIVNTSKNPEERNRSIETAARFLNMHAQSGVPATNMKVALVVHGNASKDIMNNEAYRELFAVDNPNSEMLQQLLDAGVDIVLCGQSAKSRNIPKEKQHSGVQMALSAMTALIQLQQNGYQPITF